MGTFPAAKLMMEAKQRGALPCLNESQMMSGSIQGFDMNAGNERIDFDQWNDLHN